MPQGRESRDVSTHTVHFYEEDSLFLDSLGEFVGAALGGGGSCIVIATHAHSCALADRLRAAGIDLQFLIQQKRYILRDAHETLARFLVNGSPDEGLFYATIEPILIEAQAASTRKKNAVYAFGEMVAQLWAQGKYEVAIRLEQMWNQLAREHSFTLRCAYPSDCFAHESQNALYRRVCAEHDHVMPSEGYTLLDNDADRWRLVSSLQQQASTAKAAIEMREKEIEQRVRVEEKLRQSEQFAKTIIESSVDCVKVLDMKGRIEYMSPPGLKALDVDDINQILGHRWVDYWSEEDRPLAEAAVAAAVAGDVGSFRGEFPTARGAMKCWDVKITPSRGPDGAVERLIAVSRDITELRGAQLAAIHAEKLATAGRMAATIAHEINNPLEAVTNFIYLAQTTEGLPAEVRQHLEIADRELTRVAHIARQTLGFYRSNSMSRWMVVSDLIRDALMIYERRLHNKEMDAEITIDPDLQIYGKDGELRQVLLNLTANAIDASHTGGKLWFRAQKTRNWTNGMEEGVRITLADNGSGMAPEVQRSVFDPFFTTKADVGTGIGLWVTKCLVEQRGGYVHFRSRQGQNAGTVMSLFLPTKGKVDKADHPA